MSENRARRLEELRQAYESGILGEDTYRAAVAALGMEAGIQAKAEGRGAIAQDHSVATGAGGVAVGGDIQGNVYVGPPARDPAEALHIYCRVLVGTGRHLPLRGVDLGASDPSSGQQPLDLAQIYVDVDTKTMVPLAEEDKDHRERRAAFETRETRPLRALEATVDNRRLVMLGDPGSGKSTFVNHLSLCLAAGWAGSPAGRKARLASCPFRSLCATLHGGYQRTCKRLSPATCGALSSAAWRPRTWPLSRSRCVRRWKRARLSSC
jgi:hypothetical protein